MQQVDTGLWSGTTSRGQIHDFFRCFDNLDISLIQTVIPFKGYKFGPGEFGEIIREVQGLNPDYCVMGVNTGEYELIVISNYASH